MKKIYQDRDWLWEHYIVRGESSPNMAKMARCDKETIRRWLYRYKIPVRGYSESTFLARRNSVIIAPGLLKFMGGEIVGDGHVGMTGKWSAFYSHGSKYQQYVTWLSGLFAEWGIGQSGEIGRHKDKKTGRVYYKYTSRSYPELVPIYKRWYPNGKKIIPQDLELTPIMARQWYLGDGCLKNPTSHCPGIELSTDDFDYPSIEHLLGELNRLGFKATHQPARNRIYLSVRSVPDFLKWIGPCPISCYDYKWDCEKK